MVLQRFFDSNKLFKKLYLALIVWIIFLLSFVGATVFITWEMEGRGISINQAGQLRKIVYSLVAINHTDYPRKEAEIDFFNTYIDVLEQRYIPTFSSQENIKLLADIQQLKQQFNLFAIEINNEYARSEDLIKQADVLDVMLHDFVQTIEQQNTQSIILLRLLRLILLSLLIISAILATVLLKKIVINPLLAINIGINKIKEGQFATRINISSRDEFYDVSQGFNQMASNLQDLYANLEQKVNDKTLKLEKKNQEWAILHDISTVLFEYHSNQDLFDEFLVGVINISGARTGSIALVDQLNGRLKLVSTKNTIFSGEKEIFPIKYKGKLLGEVYLEFKQQNDLKQDSYHLLELLMQQLGIAIANMRIIEQDKKIAVLEERNLLAQGLHDSIAQSLSFIKLQLELLKNAFKQQEYGKVSKNIGYIETGINQSYDDIRELLTNFRIKLTKESTMALIKDVLERYQQQQQQQQIVLKSTVDEINLNAEQQLQVIFILQEALSNIRKHAQAANIIISITNVDGFIIKIEDDGRGFNPELYQNQDNHYGLKIMLERASKIGAKITIQSQENKGTAITIFIAKDQD